MLSVLPTNTPSASSSVTNGEVGDVRVIVDILLYTVPYAKRYRIYMIQSVWNDHMVVSSFF